jgi:ABC-2 type transport system permease protein
MKRLEENKSLRVQTAETLGVPVLDRQTAANLVRRGDLTAYILLKKDYGDSLLDFAAEDVAGIDIGIDPSRQAEQGLLQGVLMESTFATLADQFMKPEAMKKQTDKALKELDKAGINPIQKAALRQMFAALDNLAGKFDSKEMKAGGPFRGPRITTIEVRGEEKVTSRLRSPYEITIPSAVSWSLLSSMITFAVSIVVERKQGTLLRLRIAPISKTEILAGKGLACFVSCVAGSAVLLFLGWLFFNVRVENVFYLALAIVSAAVCFVGLMMLVSVIGKTEQAVGGAGSGLMVTMAMLGGGMMPLAFMPEWMQVVSNVSPVKWTILAMEGAIWRGFSFVEMLLPCAILIAVGLATFGLGIYILSRREG